jgi:hypothetical protein
MGAFAAGAFTAADDDRPDVVQPRGRVISHHRLWPERPVRTARSDCHRLAAFVVDGMPSTIVGVTLRSGSNAAPTAYEPVRRTAVRAALRYAGTDRARVRPIS